MDNKVLAVLNGREITQRELDETILKFPQERQSYLRTEEGRKQLLDEIVNFELIYNYAKDNNMEADKDYALQMERAKKEILTQVAIAKLLSQVKVSEEELENYYNNNKNMFMKEETISAKHILVDTLDKANDVIKCINEGMTFEEAANKYSKCPSKSSGGNLGEFGKGRMVPEFEKAAFSLEVGVISAPVKTQFGYHIIKIESKNPASIIPLDEIRNDIRIQLLQQNQKKRYMEFTNELKNKYSVEIK
ncbi:peptidylprolyl isomerase [Clostridium lundense]|uniref:peptidylprolyl isomerase n=1 Tax=Clostridium lundense TaxID=319475 RepID=UPI000484CBEE|nr:peptidylprolyl isomerase [Clostridium lundense]